MAFVKTKIALEGLEPGDIPELLVLAGEALDNIPRFVRAKGHKIPALEPVTGGVHKILIERTGRKSGEDAG
jgi:tRNA 2-thiouridine synthesizing protein A